MIHKTTRPERTLIKKYIGKTIAISFLIVTFIISALAQDDDAIGAKVLDANNRTVGKAELITDNGEVKTNFGYYIKMWTDGGTMRIIRPQSGSRASGISCSVREYKVDVTNPRDSSKWDETGSGTATLQMAATVDVQKITATIIINKRYKGDSEFSVKESPQKFTVVLE